MNKYVNRWTALCAWVTLVGIVWALFAPGQIAVGTLVLLGLTGCLVVVAASVLWSAHLPTPSIGQSRVEAEAAAARARR